VSDFPYRALAIALLCFLAPSVSELKTALAGTAAAI
jgi:hypothetical protein